MNQESPITLKLINQLKSIDSCSWNRCANPPIGSNGPPARYDPFVSHEFLQALEESGSATAETGWYPHHLMAESASGEILGVLPMYLKQHSRGEFVFDFGWAEAFERAGGSYYPKLQVAVPFTPVTGQRILVPPQPSKDRIQKQLLTGAIGLLEQYQASSLHITFIDRALWEQLGKMGFLLRMDQQFHWKNNNYGAFADFLGELSSKKRRAILRERKQACENGITIEQLTGSAIQETHWDAFFRFYQDTGSRKWGSPYLTRDFFSLIGKSMPDNILLILAKRNGRYIAGALNFLGSDTLFGRYWGCLESHPFLHFEVCYYQAIEYAIENKLSYVEAGAQGEHKLARGYLPNYTYSAHWIANEGLREAVSKYLFSERDMVRDDMLILKQHSPYRVR